MILRLSAGLILALGMASTALANTQIPLANSDAGQVNMSADTQTYDPSLDPERYANCLKAINEDAAKVAEYAFKWQAMGGGLPARHCLALAQMELGEHAQAASTLMRAAQQAEAQKSPMAADFWGQAGNAALLAGDSKNAISYFSSGLVAAGEFAPLRSANLHIDRARAHLDAGDQAAARADLNKALVLAPKDEMAWLLSATLARRQNDLTRAKSDIAKAAELSPKNADILLEQGNIAGLSGDIAAARTYWEKIRAIAPDSDAARLAAQALAANPAN